MSENLISIDDNPLKKYFNDLAQKSFNKEWRIYSEYNRIIKKQKGKPIKNIEDLNAQTCSKLFSVLSSTEEDFLSVLRDKRIYNKIVNLPVDNLKEKGISKTLFVENFLKGKESISKEIKEVIEETNREDNNIKITNDLVGQILEIIESKRKQLDIPDETLELSISEENVDEEGFKFEIRTKGDKVLWKQEETIELVRQIQKKYNLSIIKKSDYYIIEPSVIENDQIAEAFLKKLENAIDAIYNNTVKIPDFFKTKLREVLKNNDARALLTGAKTHNKVRGDIGEFLVGVFNKTSFGQEGVFVGDVYTSSGQAAVDIYLGKLGFQVKNFPGQEQSSIIPLYSSIEEISKENNSETRGLSTTQKDLLYQNFNELLLLKQKDNNEDNNKNEDVLKQQIIEILKIALPNFMRYSQRFIEEEIKQNTELRKLSNLKNNIYILNFRIIPASRIFYELAESIGKSKAKQTIENLFYTKKTKTLNITDKNNLFTVINKNTKSIDPFYLYFRGIQINYKGLRAGSGSQNLLAETFKEKITFF